MDPLPPEPTLPELRQRLAPLIAANAGFDGWTEAALVAAAEQAGVDADIARLAFREGAVQMIDAWFAHVDTAMAQRLAPASLAAMKVRQRIQALVEARLDIMLPDREALRRAVAILALPTHLTSAARLGWRSADLMWRLAGDRATDFNHYSKRALLLGVYGSTIAVFLDDDSEELADSRGFLARRIDDVMRIERAKAQWRSQRDHLPSLSRFIGRLRYPPR